MNGLWVICPCGAEGWGDEIGAKWDPEQRVYIMACCGRRDHFGPSGTLRMTLKSEPLRAA